MHELNIVKTVIEVMEQELRRARARRLKGLKVRVNELTEVSAGALKLYFDECVKGTKMEGALLEIEEVALRWRCASCGASYRTPVRKCPKCKGASIEEALPPPIEIVSMEVD